MNEITPVKIRRPYVTAARHEKLRASRDRLKIGNAALARRLEQAERRAALLEERLLRSKRAGLAALADWQHEYIRALEGLCPHPERLREIRGRGESLRRAAGGSSP